MSRKSKTVNQLNSFLSQNPVLHRFVEWRNLENVLPKAWREELVGEPQRGLQRKTFRGNCIYGNLLKSISAFSGIDVRQYNYHRDNLTFYLDVDWRVKLDIDGVWISATFPWQDDPGSWNTTTYFSEKLRANVPFDSGMLLPIIKRYNDRFFYPEDCILGKIQRRFRKSKKQAVAKLKEMLTHKENAWPLDIDDPDVQKALTRRLRRKKNIIAEVVLSKQAFNQLHRQERFKVQHRARRFDMSWAYDLDGDVDEIEQEFYNQMEDHVLYVE